MCTQPHIKDILTRSRQNIHGKFPPRVNWTTDIQLDVLEDNNRADFFITTAVSATTHHGLFESQLRRYLNDRNFRRRQLREIDRTLSLDESIPWKTVGKKNVGIKNPHLERKKIPMYKRATIEDLMRHPEWLESFQYAMQQELSGASLATNVQIRQQRSWIEQGSIPPLAQVVSDLSQQTKDYSLNDLFLISQQATTTLHWPPQISRELITETVRTLVAQMIEEQLKGLQTGHIPTARRRNETLAERFARRSRDPEKMTQLLLTLSHLIPGSQQVTTILEAINIMFGPEETTR